MYFSIGRHRNIFYFTKRPVPLIMLDGWLDKTDGFSALYFVLTFHHLPNGDIFLRYPGALAVAATKQPHPVLEISVLIKIGSGADRGCMLNCSWEKGRISPPSCMPQWDSLQVIPNDQSAASSPFNLGTLRQHNPIAKCIGFPLHWHDIIVPMREINMYSSSSQTGPTSGLWDD